MLHTFQYWKSEIHGNLEEFYRYNARDAYGTAISFLALIAEMPEWATIITCWNFSCLSLPPIREYWNTSREEQISFNEKPA